MKTVIEKWGTKEKYTQQSSLARIGWFSLLLFIQSINVSVTTQTYAHLDGEGISVTELAQIAEELSKHLLLLD